MNKPFRRVIKTMPIDTPVKKHVFGVMHFWYCGWFRAQGKDPHQCANFEPMDKDPFRYRITITDKDAWDCIAPFFGLSKLD